MFRDVAVIPKGAGVPFHIRFKYSYGLHWVKIESVTGKTLRKWFLMSSDAIHDWLSRLDVLRELD